MSTEQVEAVDHAEEARGILQWAAGEEGPNAFNAEDARTQPALELAQVHASLAIAEQLGRLNEQLEKGAIEVIYGGRTV